MIWTWDIIRRIIEVLWLINIGFAIWTVFRSRRDIAATWAWLLVLSVFPVAGFILYMFVGRQLSHDDIFTIQEEQAKYQNTFLKKQHRLLEQHELLPQSNQKPRARMLANLNLNNDEALLTFDNHVEVFTDGHAKFEQLIDDINHAKKIVDVEYYTFYADHLGKRILDALVHAAKRGVKVRVLYDASGSRGTKPSFFEPLEKLGGQAQAFISSSSKWYTSPRLNYHLHRKLVIIDHQIGYIGGFNIGDQYLGDSPKFGYWRDTHLRVVGQASVMMEVRFAMDWNTTCRKTRKPKFSIDDELKDFTIKHPQSTNPDEVPMQIVSSGPDNQNYAIRRGYEGIIATARKYVYIQSPYLIPEDSILEALIIAAKSGIDVRIMVPCMPDHPFVYRMTEYYAKYLVQNGVKVYRYDNGFIHAKTMVSGSNIASVGSANQDYRSYKLNFEVNAFTYNSQLSSELKKIFEADLLNCTPMTEEFFAKQSRWLKFKQQFSHLLAPIF